MYTVPVYQVWKNRFCLAGQLLTLQQWKGGGEDLFFSEESDGGALAVLEHVKAFVP